METGVLVEYIDRRTIVCAIVLQTKKNKVRLLTQSNRETSVSQNRIFGENGRLDPDLGRDRLVAILAETARNRDKLKKHVNIEVLWEVLNTESEWIDAETMAEFSFEQSPDPDQVSATRRAFFEDKLYFKFDVERFFPHTPEQVDQKLLQAAKEARRKKLIEQGVEWVRQAREQEKPQVSPLQEPIINILKSVYLFGKDSSLWNEGKEILSKSKLDMGKDLFDLLCAAGVWDEFTNLDLLRLDIPMEFPEETSQEAARLAESPSMYTEPCNRRDLTGLPVLTIDGQATQDFDDALSLEPDGDGWRVGIHISDTAHFISRGSLVDAEAMSRASSIYLPDGKLPMLPPVLAEGLCSLKADQVRPAVSIMVRLDADANVMDYEVFPSIIRVRRQLTYHEVNCMADADKEVIVLTGLARRLRQKRLDNGAVLITLPEVTLWVDEDKLIHLHKINREGASRLLVSEMMILANQTMANFLSDADMPAVFRCQPEPRKRLFEKDQGTLFQNWMQRRHLNRFLLLPRAEPHSGIGVDAYTTATSPIRKYLDLVTQRQIRGALGVGVPYSQKEVEEIIASVQLPLSRVSRVQFLRNRFWLLRYLEQRKEDSLEAIVLDRRRDRYMVLLTETMMECPLPLKSNPTLLPEDVIRVAIQKVEPANQLLQLEPA